MIKIVRRILAVFLLALVSAAIIRLPVLAQNAAEPTGFKNVHLWINPEYDDPRLLVMLEGQIDGVPAPATVRFLVPAAAEMYSAGYKDDTGKYTGGPPNRKTSTIPGWDEISYEVKTPTFRVEYYDQSINGQPDKSIAYEFKTLYPISDLQVIVQQPRSSTRFAVSPPGDPYTDSEGFNTRVYSYTQVGVDQPVSFNITYTKTDARPSLAINGGGASSMTVALIVIIVLVLVSGGVLWWSIGSRRKRGARRPSQRVDGGIRKAGTPGNKRFCGQCGKPSDSANKYCPYCGAKTS